MFARIPDAHAPPATHAWGRTPVDATVDGRAWATSVWRDRAHGTLLPVPKRLLGRQGGGRRRVRRAAAPGCVTLAEHQLSP